MSDDNDYGFSGLGKRLDDIPPIKEVNTHESARVEPHSKDSEINLSDANTHTPPAEPVRTQLPAADPPNNAPKIIFGVIALCILVAIFSGNDNKSSNSTGNNYTAPDSSTQTTSNTAVEQLPPIGSGNVLSRNEIRYCLSEKIRINKIQSIINYYSEIEVNNMNSLVNDYNSRCAHFRYKRGMLESVRSDVNSNTYTLENSATNTVNSWRTSQNNISQPPQSNYNYKSNESVTYTPDNNHKKRSLKHAYPNNNSQYYDRTSQKQFHQNAVKQSSVTQVEEKVVSYSSLPPNQRASIDMDCFEAKVKGEFFFNECRESKAARYSKK